MGLRELVAETRRLADRLDQETELALKRLAAAESETADGGVGSVLRDVQGRSRQRLQELEQEVERLTQEKENLAADLQRLEGEHRALLETMV